MGTPRYVALGPLLSGEGSRAFLGLRFSEGEASPCALVWVPEHVMQDPELTEQLRRDTSRAAGLVHPNVMRVWGLIEVDEGLARVTEFADSESLRRVLDIAQRLPPGFAARMLVDAALGVQYAHVAGNEDGTPLVHGDLRPETLLVSYHGLTKVTGYGALTVAPKEMGGQRVMGRRTHSAPEQILGGRAAVTEQTDVYLLGLILYEALTGSVPFTDAPDFDKAVLNDEPPLLNSESVPPKLRPVIAKAMAKKGLQRFQTVQAFHEAVEEAFGDLPAHAEFGAFIEKAFEADDARAARRRELENGIQEWVVKKGLKLAVPPPPPAPPPKPPPPAPVVVASAPAAVVEQAAAIATPAPEAVAAVVPAAPAPAPAVAAPPAPAPKPVARLPGDEDDDDEEPARPARKVSSPWVIAIPVAVLAVILAFWAGRRGAPEKIEYTKPVVAVGRDAAAPQLVVVPAEGPKATELPPPSRPPEVAPVAPLAAKKPELEMVVDPPVSVAVDGKAVGRTPFKIELAGGPHRLTLSDPAQGLQVVKAVNIKPGLNRVSLTLGKGAVTLDAPPGCEVRIDGRSVGKTPLAPIPVWEGSHKIQVISNGAKWSQAFSLGNGERMNFDIETHNGE